MNKSDCKLMKKRWIRLLILLFVILIISGYLSWILIRGAQDILGINKENFQIEITIPKGSSTDVIANILKENKVIKQPLTFKIYSRLKKTDNTYMSGTYILNSKMSYEDIIYAFQNSNERSDIVKITIPEGYTIREIANVLNDKKVCDKEKFLVSIDEMNFKSQGLDEVDDNELIRYKLEGYLFPDTYNFIINDKPEYIIEKMLNNFDNKIYNKLNREIQESAMSFSEIITLASIVQKESTTFDIMEKVASVFLNRLNNPMQYSRLQSDVTIFYVERDIKPSLEFANQKMYDSYNTYVCKGLPIAPICNPGYDSIKAVLNAKKTDDYYFLTDINKKYYWGKTLREHNKNLYEAEKLGSVKGIETQ